MEFIVRLIGDIGKPVCRSYDTYGPCVDAVLRQGKKKP